MGQAKQRRKVKPARRKRPIINPPALSAVAERLVREHERRAITGVGRQRWFELEAEGKAPKRVELIPGGRTVAWRLSELVAWVIERPRMSKAARS